MDSNLISLKPILDLNILPRDGKITAKSLLNLSKKMYENGVIGAMFPRLDPPVSTDLKLSLLETLSLKLENILIFQSISGLDEKGNLSEIASLSDRVSAIVIESDIDRNSLLRIFQYAKMKNKPIICKIKDRVLGGDGVINDTENSFYLGLPSRNPLGERIGVATVMEMVKFFKVKTLFSSVTDKEAIETILKGKESGLPIFLEVSIHHLLLNDDVYKNFNNWSKIDPPLQDENGRKYLLEVLKNGGIDILTSLHSSISESDKSGSFRDSKYGVLGLEKIFSLYYTTLVKDGYISLSQLEDFTFNNVVKFLNLDKELFPKRVIFDLSKTTLIYNDKSLYDKKELIGDVLEWK
jgi:dihydroorotase